jgi:hypothetical protein
MNRSGKEASRQGRKVRKGTSERLPQKGKQGSAEVHGPNAYANAKGAFQEPFRS